MNISRDAIWVDAPNPNTRTFVSVDITPDKFTSFAEGLPIPTAEQTVEMTSPHGNGVVLEADSLEWFSPVQQRLIVQLCARLTLDGVEANVRPTVAKTSLAALPSSVDMKLSSGAVIKLSSPWEKYGSAIVTSGRDTGITVPVTNDDAGEPVDMALALVHRCIALAETLVTQEDMFARSLGHKRNAFFDRWEIL